jgi:hypothetical protein
MKNFRLSLFLFLALGIFSPVFTFAQEESKSVNQIPIYVFARQDCGHCAEEEEFLKSLTQKNPQILVSIRDISDITHRTEWSEIAHLHDLPLATPITLVGNTVIQGFDSPETTGKRIEQIIQNSQGKETLSPSEMIALGKNGTAESFEGSACVDGSEVCAFPARQPLVLSLPFLGATDLSAYSLPLLSAILGFVDGFNPCAIWVLVTFLLILTQARSRKRMILIAGIFIFAEALLYWLILNVWFTTWNFVTLDRIVTPLIGLLALFGGMFFLYEWSQATGTCKIIGASTREKFMRRIHSISKAPVGIAMIFGVIGLAFSVNIIEFACSLGIPQAFTKILEFNTLNPLQEQSFMGIYIFFYMIDDLVVFALALWSINKIGLTTKYTSWTNLIGGILMVLLGFLFLFAPETLRLL